jgi:14-3-3 protein epsilon
MHACADMCPQTLWTSSEADAHLPSGQAEAPQQEEPKPEAAAEEPKAE